MIVDCDVADNTSRASSILPGYWHLAETWRPIEHLGGRFIRDIVQDDNYIVVEGIAPVESDLNIRLKVIALILVILTVLV